MVLLPIRRVDSSGFFYAFRWGAGISAIIFAVVIGFFAIVWTDTVSEDKIKSEMFLSAAGKVSDDSDVLLAVKLVRDSYFSEKVSFDDLKKVRESFKGNKVFGFAMSEWERLEPIIKDPAAYDDLDFDPDDWSDWLRTSMWIFIIGVACWSSLAYWAISARPMEMNGYSDVNPERQSSFTYPWKTPLALIFLPLYFPFIVVTQPIYIVVRLIRGIVLLIKFIIKKIVPTKKEKIVPVPSQRPATVKKSAKKKKAPEKKEVIAMEQAKRDLKKTKQEFVKFFRSGIGSLVSEAEKKVLELEKRSAHLSKELEGTDRSIAIKEKEVETLKGIASKRIEASDDVIGSEVDRILSIPGVVAVSLKDKVLLVYTEPIEIVHEGERYLLGRFKLKFDLAGTRITVHNIDPENGPGDEQHPYAQNRDGSFCFGSINSALNEFFERMDYFALVSAALTAVRSADGAGYELKKWRLVGYARGKKK